MSTDYGLILQSKRANVVDCRYYASVYLSEDGVINKSFGLPSDTLFYMRSLAKPIQASILFDCNIIDDIDILPSYIAIMAGSHSGSPKHIDILKSIMSKYQIKYSDLDISKQAPLDLRNFNGIQGKLHNNCSGKHLMMLVLSKYYGFPLYDYCNPNHPLQKLIQKKQEELSGFEATECSFDGCSTPLWAISADGIIRAYYNLISDKKYSFLINSILKYPDIYGGYERLDSDIIKLSSGKLFSKVGAGGFIIVYNLSSNQSVLIKMAQNNNAIRKLVTLDILNKLNWLNVPIEEYEYNQKNIKVAKYYYEFNI